MTATAVKKQPRLVNISADASGKPTFDVPKRVGDNLTTTQQTLTVMGSILPGELGNAARVLASGLACFLRGLEVGEMQEKDAEAT